MYLRTRPIADRLLRAKIDSRAVCLELSSGTDLTGCLTHLTDSDNDRHRLRGGGLCVLKSERLSSFSRVVEQSSRDSERPLKEIVRIFRRSPRSSQASE